MEGEEKKGGEKTRTKRERWPEVKATDQISVSSSRRRGGETLEVRGGEGRGGEVRRAGDLRYLTKPVRRSSASPRKATSCVLLHLLPSPLTLLHPSSSTLPPPHFLLCPPATRSVWGCLINPHTPAVVAGTFGRITFPFQPLIYTHTHTHLLIPPPFCPEPFCPKGRCHRRRWMKRCSSQAVFCCQSRCCDGVKLPQLWAGGVWSAKKKM